MLKGLPRFLTYCSIQAGMFLSPTYAMAPLAIFVLGLGFFERLSWLLWLRRSWLVIIMALLPALFGFPFFRDDATLASWLPYLHRSLQFLLVFLSAAWLSHGMKPLDLADLLRILLRPCGKKIAATVSRAGSLMLAFMPWARDELRTANEAALLRGSSPRRNPGRHLLALAIPVSVRALERARHSAEALSLRDRSGEYEYTEEKHAASANQEPAP